MEDKWPRLGTLPEHGSDPKLNQGYTHRASADTVDEEAGVLNLEFEDVRPARNSTAARPLKVSRVAVA